MSLLLRPKPARVLIYLKGAHGAYLSEIAKYTDTSFIFIIQLVAEFEKRGLVRKDKLGKLVYVYITKEGLEAVSHIEALVRLLDSPLHLVEGVGENPKGG